MAATLAQRGLNRLRTAWRIALSEPPPVKPLNALATACNAVFDGDEVGYKKAIIIQAAGKAADVSLDALAMQKGVGAIGSWDAREFAKQTFVVWNREVQHPFAHSGDPYVSNPYRVARFDASQRTKRKRPAEYDATVHVLELLDTAGTPAIAFRNLVEVMRALRRYIADRDVEYPLPNRASLADTLQCASDFVSPRSGGARLQAVVFALFLSLQRAGLRYSDLRSRHVNASDTSSTAAGDVAFMLGDASTAVEVKDRSLDAGELASTIQKCRIAMVREVMFVIRAPNLLAADLPFSEFERMCAEQFSSGLNIYLEPFNQILTSVLAIIGEAGRREFLESVGMALAQQNADVTHRWAWAALVKSI